jgi:acid phosphatase type 7
MRALPLALLLAACAASDDDDSAAEPTPIPYAPPVAAECGDGVEPGSVPGLERWPYLQLVATDGMTVAWGGVETSTAGRLLVGTDDTYGTAIDGTAALIPGSEGEQFQQFHARADGLEPSTEYCYGVEVDGVVLASGLRFHTAPVHPDAPVRFTALGDFGSGNESQLAVRDAMDPYIPETDLWLTLGDNAYGDGLYSEVHERVFGPHQRHLMQVPAFLTAGNHDWRDGDLNPFLDNWFLPDEESYWSLDYGPVHFIGLDSEVGALDLSDDNMIDWLRADLEANQDARWTVALWHHPIITGHPDRSGNVPMIGRVIPVLQEFGVDLVLTGHDHFYERFVPLRFDGFKVFEDPEGFDYIISGAGGNTLYELNDHPLDVVGERRFHFMYIEADRERIHVRAIAEDGDVIDDFEIR